MCSNETELERVVRVKGAMVDDNAEHCVGDSSSEANLSCLGFHRKDQYLLSPVNCWYLVLHQTRRESRDHATLNDIFMNNVIVRLSQISEDVIRLFKKVGKGATPPAQISLPQADHDKIASQIWFGGVGPGGHVCCRVQGPRARCGVPDSESES